VRIPLVLEIKDLLTACLGSPRTCRRVARAHKESRNRPDESRDGRHEVAGGTAGMSAYGP